MIPAESVLAPQHKPEKKLAPSGSGKKLPPHTKPGLVQKPMKVPARPKDPIKEQPKNPSKEPLKEHKKEAKKAVPAAAKHVKPPAKHEAAKIGPTKGKANAKETKGAIAKYGEELRQIIEQSILTKASTVRWEDLIGLESMKKRMQECIVLPIKNPKIFTGLLTPSKGILLFGPPGNGKTMVAKAVASECGEEVTFFNMSAGALTSRYFGDSEKLVRALFEAANERQPSVIFIDEIDSILGARSSGELEVTRRLKTEFLVQFDGVGTRAENRVLVIGATNRPFDLDEAVLRRFTARVFLPLPSVEARANMLRAQLATVKSVVHEGEVAAIAKRTEGYSFADLKTLCQEAAMEPMRSMGFSILVKIEKKDLPEVTVAHFEAALKKVPPSVSQKSIQEFEKWQKDNQK